jgi:hypothetical protein
MIKNICWFLVNYFNESNIILMDYTINEGEREKISAKKM